MCLRLWNINKWCLIVLSYPFFITINHGTNLLKFVKTKYVYLDNKSAGW